VDGQQLKSAKTMSQWLVEPGLVLEEYWEGEMTGKEAKEP
jgi:hypothetical protein